MPDNEYPKFICRPGKVEEAWGIWIEPSFAENADDLADKLANGWYLRPDQFDDPAAEPETPARKPGRPRKATVEESDQ